MSTRKFTLSAVGLMIFSAFSGAADAKPGEPRRIDLTVTERGFDPGKVTVKRGEEVRLVFTRKTDNTCAKEVVIRTDKEKIEKKLPLNEAITITTSFPKAGEIRFACGMDMHGGVIVVQ